VVFVELQIHYNPQIVTQLLNLMMKKNNLVIVLMATLQILLTHNNVN